MPTPPKPKGTPDDLAEVERALSVLQGRHPELERARREDGEKRAQRMAQADAEASVASTEARSRSFRLAAVAVPVALLVVFLALLGRREMGRRDAVSGAVAPFLALGFTVVETSSPSSTGALEATVEPGCLLAVSTDPERGPIAITRASATTQGRGPTLFCTCTSERIGVSASVRSGGGVALLRVDAASLGGSRAFALAPLAPGSTLRTDEACSEASLDAWLTAKRYPSPKPEPEPAGALAAAGFRQALTAPAEAPFLVLDVPKESCLLASSSAPTDRLELRLAGGERPVTDAAGSFLRCAQAAGTAMVSREGRGVLTVRVAPAAPAGGSWGLRQLLRHTPLSRAALVLAPGDRPWDAKLLLMASQIPEATITTGASPDVPDDRDARVVALSFETPNALTPETPADTFSYCDPPLDPSMREAICVFSGAQKWRNGGGATSEGGLARARLPPWLFAMQAASDPNALKGITQLLALARRLARDGFTPTTIEALTELPGGTEVLGRAGEDAVVAVGVVPVEPWVYPLSDGAPWTLGEAPRVVALRPLQRITLTAALRALPPKALRHTVVFRRPTR
jgi:hypothetical protein